MSILSIIAAFLLIYSPFEGTVALIICLGISLVIDGVQSLFFIHNVAKSIRKLGPVDVDYIEVE